MSPLKAAKEITKIEAKVAPKPSDSQTPEIDPKTGKPKVVEKEKEKKITKAPEPIKPPRGTGVTEKDPEGMNAKEYRAWRESKKG